MVNPFSIYSKDDRPNFLMTLYVSNECLLLGMRGGTNQNNYGHFDMFIKMSMVYYKCFDQGLYARRMKSNCGFKVIT